VATIELTKPVIRIASEGERIGFGGIEAIFKSPAAGSNEGWTAVDYTLPARQFGAPLHYHRQLTESFYVISGKLWMRVDDCEVSAGPGSYVLVPPGTLHSFANRTDAPARFLGHASNPDHKAFLCELFRLAETEPVWPPQDPKKIVALGERYDTFYL
jgi:mannose-6-phosphate isomerase-like protein (cupin superfamily)